MRHTPAEYTDKHRDKLILADLCIWSCGRASATPCGLCSECYAIHKKRCRNRYQAERGIPLT